MPPTKSTVVASKKQQPPAASSSQQPAAEEKKPPSVQEIIGGKSWTGKLPQTLFYEHCVRQGWEKPQYDNPKREKSGFVTAVHIGLKNTRTSEIQRITFRPPAELPWVPQPTPLESRHLCATYALHRVCSMKNIHHMLPPTHKQFWSALEEIRQEEQKAGKAWRYEADPFAVKREHDAARAKAEKQKAAAGKDPKKAANLLLGGKSKGWQSVPVVDMSCDRRRETEDLIRRYHVWNPHGVEMKKEVKETIIQELTDLGFKKLHIEEACDWVKDREEALEWLLIHVPEDDVPQRFLPENYAAGITMSTGESLGTDYAARRLAAAGYSLDLCYEALHRNSLNEDRAAEALMQMLVHGNQTSPEGPIEEYMIDLTDPDDANIWNEELQSLDAIYGPERFTVVSPQVCRVLLELQQSEGENLPKIILEVRKPTAYPGSLIYPEVIPTLAIVTEGDGRLAAYVRLSIIKQVAEYAETLKGEQMIFTIVDWLENEIIRIIESPGRLRDVATAVTGSDERNDRPSAENRKRRRNRAKKGPIDWTPGTKASIDVLRNTEERLQSPQQKKMLQARQSLPAWQRREDIVNAVNSAQVVIISGETGSGKSTQSVQFILDNMIQRKLGSVANIVCTQPRRISALGLADRVSDERCQTVGQEVGYAIRGESRQTHGVTKVTFVTTGVLLRRLQTGDTLEDVSHIVIDEVHERSLDTDFLLILVKRIIARRKDLKIVLMSATLDAAVFSEYFGGDTIVKRVNIEGRTFPVTDHYLDAVIAKTEFTGRGVGAGGRRYENAVEEGIDPAVGHIIRGLGDRINYNLIAATVMYIDRRLGDADGAILIFLPGTMEISRCIDAIKTLPNGSNRYHALPLHAALTPAEQRRVFPAPPLGRRKVIAATNVAETSITIEDVVCVIDTGRVKETSFDPADNVVKLQEVWASRAAAKQRRGRAGRVRAGECYKLYTKDTEERKMPERPEPELKRVPLEKTCLGVKAMGIKDVRAFLAAALSPPNTMAVENALMVLEKMGAVIDDELSALGRHMALIPADLRCSKLMVYGVLFGCLDPAITIASILTARSPFVSQMDKREESKSVRTRFANQQGDLLADCRAWEQWSEMRKSHSYKEVRTWCDENFLSHQTLLDIASNRSQYLDALRETGFLLISRGVMLPPDLNRNSENNVLIRALIAGAFTPQIARIQMPQQKFASSSSGALAVDPEAKTIKYFTNDNGRVFAHPSSTVSEAQSFPNNAGFLTFFGRMATSKVFLRDCTPVGAYALLLLGGKVEVDTLGRGITVDGWIRLRGWGRIGILVQRLRAMLDGVLGDMIDNPDLAAGASGEKEEVVNCVVGLIEGEGI
ncbi:P-loop containing nucleoside triphosphate hydrolase protein [Sphaerosporella brunnea]|uniref:P-loop containing nucleoside triphosphate hydrolase protein n=1 Tax=Sphaerosporella brunnea TaxID=1250544 RepID=A0A5J5ENK0_9PEZI|nr:P-loop containing nucleoside triphosphate hydrolase protein [Sphaerosporella brunnea]